MRDYYYYYCSLAILSGSQTVVKRPRAPRRRDSCMILMFGLMLVKMMGSNQVVVPSDLPNVEHDAVVLLLRNLMTLVRVRSEWIAESPAQCTSSGTRRRPQTGRRSKSQRSMPDRDFSDISTHQHSGIKQGSILERRGTTHKIPCELQPIARSKSVSSRMTSDPRPRDRA